MTMNTISTLVAMSTLCLALACGGSNQRNHAVLIDNSGSLTADLILKIRESVAEDSAKFAKGARLGDSFTVWFFSKDKYSPYAAEHKSFTFPALKPPAYRSRDTAVRDLQAKVEAALKQLPQGVSETPLLESICLLSSTTGRDAAWTLSIFSDLHQESNRWRYRNAESAQETASRMISLCPPARTPPDSITLYGWPGRTGGRDHNVQQFTRDTDAFQSYMDLWAPNAPVRVIHLK